MKTSNRNSKKLLSTISTITLSLSLLLTPILTSPTLASDNITNTQSTKSAKQATLKSITITTPPTKTVYYWNGKFDPTGMIVTANYSDNTHKDVTNLCTNNFDSSTVGNKIVTVKFGGKRAGFRIKVKYELTENPDRPVKYIL